MKIHYKLLSALVVCFILSCETEPEESTPKKCISYWRSGNWETSYGFRGSGVFYDAMSDNSIAFQGTFKARESSNGQVEFSVSPDGLFGVYPIGWAHSFFGNSNCTQEFLISTNKRNSSRQVDMQASKKNNKIEASGDYYDYDEDNDKYVYQGSMIFITN